MKNIIWLFCLICTACVQAQTVSKDEVRAYANLWLKKNPLVIHYRDTKGVPLEIRSIELLELEESHLPFYLVHLNPQGYIVIQSDRRLKPVLCFSISANASLEERQDNAFYQLLLIQGEKNAEWISSSLTSTSALSEWNVRPQFQLMSTTFSSDLDEGDVIGPLLRTSWDQRNHYNEYCPLDPNAPAYYDGHAPVGCVATAFAQIMKYHEWPYRGTGSITYEDTNGDIIGTHTAVFSDPYEWWHMQDEYFAWGAEPEEAVNAVSELMYELGVAAGMDYESGASSSSSRKLGYEIQKHFFYEALTYTESSSLSQFEDSVLNDLFEQRPCVASIPDHAFVIDGCMKEEEDTYFHINYGWSGKNDGWFLMKDVQGEAITEVLTEIRPMLIALHLDNEYTTNGLELRWVLPKTRSEEVTRVDVLKRNTVSGTWKDEAEQFDTFEITSTNDFKDWSLSSLGYTGDCFYKTPGGYGNREYHLTSNRSFRPKQETRLVFKAKYVLWKDGFSVLVSNDSGNSFSSVWSVSDISQEDWTEIQIPLGAFSQQDILVRFEYLPGSYYQSGGIWIDEIQLVSAEWHQWSVIHQVNELTAYRPEFITSFQDEAEDLSIFEVTSTSGFKDWALSSEGYTGNCFYKAPGGYGNREYHLTSTRSFRPKQETRLTFKAKYALFEDGFSVLVSTDNGSSFSSVWSVSNTSRENWTEIQVPLEAFSQKDILIRFEYLTGGHYPQGGIWIDEVRLIDITGADYLKYPVYYTYPVNLTEGVNTLAYQVWAGGRVHPRSEEFTVDF